MPFSSKAPRARLRAHARLSRIRAPVQAPRAVDYRAEMLIAFTTAGSWR